MILYTRNSDGTYTRAGELPASVRRVRIEVARDHVDCFDNGDYATYTKNDALRLIDAAIAAGLAARKAYRVVAVESTEDARMEPAVADVLARVAFYKRVERMTDAQVARIVAWG